MELEIAGKKNKNRKDDAVFNDEYAKCLTDKIKTHKSMWEDPEEFNLSSMRKQAKEAFRGKIKPDNRQGAEYETWDDNEIFVAVNAAMSFAFARNPRPRILPTSNKDEDKVSARQVEKYLALWTRRVKLKQKLKTAGKDRQIKAVGVLKAYYDVEDNEVYIKAVDPENVVLDFFCPLGGEPEFIAETVKGVTRAQLLATFSTARDRVLEILQDVVLEKQNEDENRYDYLEVHWTHRDEATGEPTEMMGYLLEDKFVQYGKTPYYNYGKDKGVKTENILTVPTKPYQFLNDEICNSGQHLIDETTPLWQAIPAQARLNRRQRQVTENADTANPVIFYKKGSIADDKRTAIDGRKIQSAELKGAGEEAISSLFAVKPPNMLPQYTLNDIIDTRNVIHNIMATPSEFRGDASSSETSTLGESEMVMGQAQMRQSDQLDTIDAACERLYGIVLQIMKLHYKGTKTLGEVDNDGTFAEIEISAEKIPYNLRCEIVAGSTAREDKNERESRAMALASKGLIDPKTLFDDLGYDNSAQRLEALVGWQNDPAAYVSNTSSDALDELAYMDYIAIMNGKEVEPREDVDDKHIASHRKQMVTNRFMSSDAKVQSNFLIHVQAEIELWAKRNALDQSAIPPPQEAPQAPQPPEMGIDPSQPAQAPPAPAPAPPQPPMPPQGGM